MGIAKNGQLSRINYFLNKFTVFIPTQTSRKQINTNGDINEKILMPNKNNNGSASMNNLET